MELRKVAVLGGGPGGLYTARLVKLAWPECEVEVFEQSPPATTFGFGVGLATRTQRNLASADPASFESIVDAAYSHDMAMVVGDQSAHLPGGNLIAIGRSTLLGVLRDHALEAGVRVHHGERVDVVDLEADPTIDLIIAADGVSSATRQRYADDFGVDVAISDGLYLWAGTELALPTAIFRPVTSEFGTFVAHAYPYAPDRSTFLVETDAETWRRAGFDATTEATAPEDNDEASLAYLSGLFKEDLQGEPLAGNRTRWTQFRTVRCERWHRGNVVLLGDAAHTAHYSIGSGTKLAMEDGIALVAALSEAADLPSALESYDRSRHQAVEYLQGIAERSLRWWDHFPDRLTLPVERLMVAYMTRAGKVDLARFAITAPPIARAALEQYAGAEPPVGLDGAVGLEGQELDDWALAQPLHRDGRTWASRVVTADELGTVVEIIPPSDPYSEQADAQLAGLKEPGAAGTVVVGSGAPDAGATLDAGDFAERVHAAGALTVLRCAAEHRALAAAALVSGRADLVQFASPASDAAPA